MAKSIYRLGSLAKNSNQLLKCNKQILNQKLYGSTSAYTARYEFDTLLVSSPEDHILSVELNKPDSYNTINKEMFRELHECFKRINDDSQARVVVLSGAGTRFSSGMDYEDMFRYMEKISGKKISENSTTEPLKEDVARKAKLIRNMLLQFQESFSVIEKCSKPVIAAVNGSCIGAAFALLCATDIRYASKDAYFKIKEVDTGFAPDLGTLQRLPKITGNHSIARELVFTARKLEANEAKEIGLLSKVFPDAQSCKQAAFETAKIIAKKSPVAVQGSKILLKYSREHSTYDGLRMSCNWSMSMLQSEDLYIAATALMENREPEFNDL